MLTLDYSARLVFQSMC